MKNQLKKIIIVPHCFTTKGFTPQYRESMDEVLQILFNYKAGIIQMPCPHLILLQEKEKCKKSFNNNDNLDDSWKSSDLSYLYSKHLNSYMMQVDEYKKQGFKIAGLIGVRKSPTCTLKSLSGESKSGQGVFMNILKQKLEDRDIRISMANIDIPVSNQDI